MSELDNQINVEGYNNAEGYLSREEKRTEAKKEREGLGLFRRFVNMTQKVNPAAVIPRLGILACFRLNVFGMARRLYPAFLSESELKSRNFDVENAKKAKNIWDSKIKGMWIMLGGRSVTLEEAIRKGYDKPIFNTKKQKAAKAHEKKSSINSEVYSQVSGYDDAAYVSAGIGFVSSMAQILTNNGVSKNPYKKGTPQYDSASKDLATAQAGGYSDGTPASEAEMQKAFKDAEADMNNGGADDEGIFGIPKIWFYGGLVAIVIIIGGIIVYNSNSKKQ